MSDNRSPLTGGGGGVGCGELALGFLTVGLTGFGGAQPVARWVIVDQRRWLSDSEYGAILGIAQTLPGANTVNAAVIVGERFCGWRGALTAVAALLAAPIVILVVFALLLQRFGALADVRTALAGVAAGAAGMVLASGLKMAACVRLDAAAVLIGVGAFVAVAVLGWPVPLTVLVLAPIGLVLTRGGARERL